MQNLWTCKLKIHFDYLPRCNSLSFLDPTINKSPYRKMSSILMMGFVISTLTHQNVVLMVMIVQVMEIFALNVLLTCSRTL